jgi:hypothetical protein
MQTPISIARSVLEKPCFDYQGIIKELGAKNPIGVGKELPLSWESVCHFSASDYTICLRQKGN